MYDVIIIGSGGAGLSAALSAKEKQIKYLLYQKPTLLILKQCKHKVE